MGSFDISIFTGNNAIHNNGVLLMDFLIRTLKDHTYSKRRELLDQIINERLN